MTANSRTSRRYHFDEDSLPAVQLLAFSLELRKLLQSHGSLTCFMPKSVFQAVPASTFQELVFDTLSPLHLDLGNRLSLKVHDAEHFEIMIDTTGKQP
jgi:hypothetical protein